jgi:ferritin-like metal-binding protein YciE
MLGEKPTGKKCAGIEGLVKEGGEVIDGDFEGAVKDAALIAAAQRVEHYEIAAYGTVRAIAELLDETEQASLLQETLDEEKATDVKLSEIADTVNPEAMHGDFEKPEVSASKPASARAPRNKRAA